MQPLTGNPTGAEQPLLALSDVSTYYGAVRAVHRVSLTVARGEIVTIIGPNGAGKSTLLKTIAGLLRPREGRIFLAGEEVTGMPAEQLVRRGLALCPEGRRVFPRSTVYENLMAGAFTRWDQKVIRENLEALYDRFPILAERRNQPAGLLSGGEQQMLAMGRALMSRPRLLLLDEPSMGLAPAVVDKIFDLIQGIRRDGTTIILVEQKADQALEVADRGYVMVTGEVRYAGTSANLLNDDRVRQLYLGDAESA